MVTNAQNPAPNPSQGSTAGAVAGTIARRFEYKYSFKPPYLAQKDGTVPFFEYSGSKLFFSILTLKNGLLKIILEKLWILDYLCLKS